MLSAVYNEMHKSKRPLNAGCGRGGRRGTHTTKLHIYALTTSLLLLEISAHDQRVERVCFLFIIK